MGFLLTSVVLGSSSLLIDPLRLPPGIHKCVGTWKLHVFLAMSFAGIITMNVAHSSRSDGTSHWHSSWVRVAAVILITVLGFPLAFTFSVPYQLTADLTADADSRQGLAIGCS